MIKNGKIQISENSPIQKLGLKIPTWVNSICLASVIPILGLQLFTDSHPVVKLITTVVIFFLVSQLIPNRNPLRQKFRFWYKDWGIEWEIDKEGCQPPDTSN